MRQIVHGRGHNKPDYRKIEQGTGFSGKPSSTLLSINRVRAVTGLYASFYGMEYVAPIHTGILIVLSALRWRTTLQNSRGTHAVKPFLIM